MLTTIADDAAWFGGVPLTLSVDCLGGVEWQQACDGGTSRICRRCTRWGIAPRSLVNDAGPPDAVWHEAGGCAGECLSSEQPEHDQFRANAALGRRTFLDVEEERHAKPEGDDAAVPHPYLFRTREACRAYVMKHPIPPALLDAW